MVPLVVKGGVYLALALMMVILFITAADFIIISIAACFAIGIPIAIEEMER